MRRSTYPASITVILLSSPAEPKRTAPPWRVFALVALAIVAAASVLSGLCYGIATGDYSHMGAMAELLPWLLKTFPR